MSDLMTIDEVVAELRVSVPTVRWLRQGGRFAPAVRMGRRLMWDRDVITNWIDQHREPTVCHTSMSSTPAGHPIDSGFLAQALATDTGSPK
jgi:predicted DNA-binding transcriptional regulator AlpA